MAQSRTAREKIHPVQIALVRHHDVLARLIRPSLRLEFAAFEPVCLPVPITVAYARMVGRFTHLYVETYSAGTDSPPALHSSPTTSPVEISPAVSVCLLRAADARSGLVATASFRGFHLPPEAWERGEPDILRKLAADSFALESGINFGDDENQSYGEATMGVGGPYDIEGEAGVAMATAQILSVTAEVFGPFSQEVLNSMAGPPRP